MRRSAKIRSGVFWPGPLNPKSLESLLDRYDVGRLLDHLPASHGIENSNYFLTTSRDGVRCRWVLTVLEQPSHSGSSYVPLLDLCHDAGLPVAPVVRNKAGDAIETVDRKAALLAPMLPGGHVDQPSVKQLEALGGFVGEFHRATGSPGFEVPAYPRDVRWLRDREARVRGHVADSDAHRVTDVVERVADLLNGKDVAGLPTGVVHGDLFRDNVLFDGPELTGVVDFHHAARSYLVYDLAVAVNDWCSGPGGALDLRRCAAMVGAYHVVRPLDDLEVALFAQFLLYAALAFWLSRLTVAVGTDRNSTTRSKDPDEFKAIVADRNANSARYGLRFLSALTSR